MKEGQEEEKFKRVGVLWQYEEIKKSERYNSGSSVSMVTVVYKHTDLTPRIVKLKIIS